jgi:hypothetical protein
MPAFGGNRLIMPLIGNLGIERRKKVRFPVNRELRYQVLDQEAMVDSGTGTTLDIGSGGIAFQTEHQFTLGALIELSISWPVLLEGSCPVRLVVFGRVIRSSAGKSACTLDKYEFRTQARAPRPIAMIRPDSMLRRWADTLRKESLKSASA